MDAIDRMFKALGADTAQTVGANPCVVPMMLLCDPSIALYQLIGMNAANALFGAPPRAACFHPRAWAMKGQDLFSISLAAACGSQAVNAMIKRPNGRQPATKAANHLERICEATKPSGKPVLQTKHLMPEKASCVSVLDSVLNWRKESQLQEQRSARKQGENGKTAKRVSSTDQLFIVH